MTTINVKCSECYGSGWVHTSKEQDEAWYDDNQDRSRPSYYTVTEPCPNCNPQAPSKLKEWSEFIRSRFGSGAS